MQVENPHLESGGFFIVQEPPKLELCYNDKNDLLSCLLRATLMSPTFGRFAGLVVALLALGAAILKVVHELENIPPA